MTLPATAPALMLDVQMEDSFVEEMIVCIIELISAAREACNVLNRAMKSVFLYYDLLEAVEQCCADIS